MKIVLNRCFGGFHLSPFALEKYAKKKGKSVYFYKQTKYDFRDKKNEYSKVSMKDADDWAYCFTNDLGDKVNSLENAEWFESGRNVDRVDPDLISVIQEYKEKCNTQVSKLEIIEIPDGVDWEIDEYDGVERVEEKHRSW